MDNILLLCVSITAYLIGNILKKKYTNTTNTNNTASILYNFFSSLSAFVFFLFFGIKTISTYTLILSLIFSIVIYLSTFLSLKAFELGPMSLSSVIISFSTVLSALSGAIFYNEIITISHIIGIILMLICFAFTVEKSNDSKTTSAKWLVVCILASLLTGLIGILQKVHQSSPYKQELNEFLLLSFLISTIISFITLIIFNKNSTTSSTCKHDKKLTPILIIICLVSGITIAINHKLNLYLSGVFDSATFFPIVNGGGLILSTLCALFIFKEKLNKKQWLGLLIGIISVIFLCNPF